jgi:hypothetical protein
MSRSHYYSCLGTYLQFVFVSLYPLKLIPIWISKYLYNYIIKLKLKVMSTVVKIPNQWFAFLEFCVRLKV